MRLSRVPEAAPLVLPEDWPAAASARTFAAEPEGASWAELQEQPAPRLLNCEQISLAPGVRQKRVNRPYRAIL